MAAEVLGVPIGSRSVRGFVTWKGEENERKVASGLLWQEGRIVTAVLSRTTCSFMGWRCGPWTDEASRDILGGLIHDYQRVAA